MNEKDAEKRIYIGDCGCVRIESKHFRVTMQPEQFVEMLREIVQKQQTIPPFCQRERNSNNVVSNSLVFIESRRREKI